MENISGVARHLRNELERAKNEVERYGAALLALGSSKLGSKLGGQRRTLSAAARRKITLAQKARWAKTRKGSRPAAAAKTTGSAPVKHTISAAGRRKIAAAQKARWAKLKAGKKAA